MIILILFLGNDKYVCNSPDYKYVEYGKPFFVV